MKEIFERYLQQKTDYALMISGEWGVGKTFYYEQILKKIATNTPLPSDNRKRYECVRVSLFGIESIKDIESRLFSSLSLSIARLGKKIPRQASRQLKLLFYEISSRIEFKNCIPTFKVGELVKKNDLNPEVSNFVLCFDDFERISSKLDYGELMGYINDLVENKSAKIVILVNENKIKADRYAALKEKVVGVSMPFGISIKDVFEEFVESKFKGSPSYRKYLESERDFILKHFAYGSNNLRILSYALVHFQDIYSGLENLKSDAWFKQFCNEDQREITQKLLQFTLAVSTEYRNGSLTHENKHEICKGAGYIRGQFLNEAYTKREEKQLNNKELIQSNEKSSFALDFWRKYGYKHQNWLFSKNIIDFIANYSAFDVAVLKKELEPQVSPSPTYKNVLNNLFDSEVFSLSDEKYKSITHEMLGYLDEGVYGISDYLQVFYCCVRYNNPFNFDIRTLKYRFINGLKNVNSSVPDLYFENIFSDSEIKYLSISDESKESMKEIRDAIFARNKELKEAEIKNEFIEIEKRIYAKNGDKKELSMILDDLVSKHYNVSFLHFFDVDNIYDFFEKNSTDVLYVFWCFFRNRYKDFPKEYIHVDEIEFMRKLKGKVEEGMQLHEKSILRKEAYRKLQGILAQSIEKYS